jgi:hypothetical protein
VRRVDKKKVLYKKNRTFFIKHIVATFDTLDEILECIQNGTYFADIPLNNEEMVDIIDIAYFHKDAAVHLVVHFAVIKQG